MREIKFRVWNGSHILDWGWICAMGMVKQIILNEEQRYQVMQYTGLKDKNGKEIYEGDIVRFLFQWFTWKDNNWIENKPDNEDPPCIYTVVWHNHGWYFESKNYESQYFSDYRQGLSWGDGIEVHWNNGKDKNRYSNFEVIGNIHKNPELLEESK